MTTALVMLVVACGSAEPGNAGNGEDGPAGAALIEGTPAGGLADWVSDVRSALSDLPSAAESDVAAAQEQALDMYVGRQEYIEMYYGPGGRLGAGSGLGEAVVEAEERFHALMQLLASSEPPTSARVAAVRDSLSAQYDVVLREAARSGVVLDPREAGP